MIHKAILAGFGGQGILMMGVTLANAAMREDKQVTYLPTYGAEVRGGTANCTVSVGDEEIASPIASNPDYLVVMNAPSLHKFQSILRKGGRCLVNTSLVHEKSIRQDVKVYEIAASEMAEELGDLRAANMIVLGSFLKISGMVKPETVLEIVEETFRRKSPEVMERNKEALWAGYRFFE
jgi:2-oxoglutarate ferredoxin oxidoreductase subunit gamma